MNTSLSLFIPCGFLNARINKLWNVTRLFHTENKAHKCISLSEMKKSLLQRNVNFTDGFTCISFKCTSCKLEHKEPKIYVNKTTGFFMCDTCGQSGSWDSMNMFLNLPNDKKYSRHSINCNRDFIKRWNEKKRECQPISEISSDIYQSISNKFSLSVISPKELSRLNCIYEPLSDKLYFPLIAFDKYIVGFKTLKSITFEEDTIPNSNASGFVIYQNKSNKNDESVIIVPTIQDLLALLSQSLANTIICLPYHLRHLPQQLLPSLEKFKKLILWFDNDESSWDSAKYFAKKLNERRCYFVRPIANQPRPKLAAEMGYNLKKIVQNAQPVWHKSITTFHNLRQDVLSDLQNNDVAQGIKWKRYPTLNKILKGHRRGEFTVLTGPTGSGKTTFMSEYSLDLAMQGVNTLWGSFEIRNVRLAKIMLQQMAGVNLENAVDSFDNYADAFEKLPIYFMAFHGQQSIEIVMDAVEHATYVNDISHVIIDNVQFMMGTSDDSKHIDRFWKQDLIIASFRSFATKFNCHVTLIIHPRKEKDSEDLSISSIFGTAKASQEADNILIIQDKRLTNIRGKKYLQVAKNRYSGDLGIMMLDFDKENLSFASRRRIKNDENQINKELVTKLHSNKS